MRSPYQLPSSSLTAVIGTIAIMTVAGGLAPAIAAADSSDPKPPQVSVDFLFPPSPLIQVGKPRLVYEMRVTNYVPVPYTLDAVEVHAGSKTFGYAGGTLRKMTRFLGEKAPAAATLKLEPGQSAIVFFILGFDERAEVPHELEHTLHPDQRTKTPAIFATTRSRPLHRGRGALVAGTRRRKLIAAAFCKFADSDIRNSADDTRLDIAEPPTVRL